MTKRSYFLFIASVFTILSYAIHSCSPGNENSEKSLLFRAGKEKALILSVGDPFRGIEFLDSLVNNLNISSLPDSDLITYAVFKAGILEKNGLNDSVLRFLSDMNQKFMTARRKDMVIWSGLLLAEKYIDDGKFFLAGKYLNDAGQLIEPDLVTFEKGWYLNLMGVLSTRQGNFRNAQNYFLEALKIFEKNTGTATIGPVYINLAANYQELHDFNLALKYNWKAKEISLKNHDSLNYTIVLTNLSTVYLDSNLDSAEYYLLRAVNFRKYHPGSDEALSARFSLGNLYYNQQKYGKALEIFNDILQKSKTYQVNKGIYRAMAGIGNVYEAQGLDGEALQIYTQAMNLAAEANETPVKLQLLEAVRYMNAKMGNYKAAYNNYAEIKLLSDSLLNLDKQIALYELEMMYNSEKTEIQNETLTNRMLAMRNRMNWNYFILALVVLTALILSVFFIKIYQLYRQRDQAYNILFEKYRLKDQPGNIPDNKPEEDSHTEPLQTKESILFQELENIFEKEKPYRNRNLKIEDIALRLNITQKLLSLLIYENSGFRFNSFVNNYRVNDALQMLSDPNFRNFKIEAIAREAGFGSKVSFYAAFTKMTGQKPSEYR